MLKWIGGCLLVCVLLVGIGLWTGYRKLASFGSSNGSETVVIAAPVTRVFASLANADSLSGWMAEGQGIKTGHHGMLVPGDTLRLEMQTRFTIDRKPMKWTVSDVAANQLLAFQLRSDSSGKLIASRQFTLTARGDSTLVLSQVASPMLDSIRGNQGDTISASTAVLGVTSKFLISALRMQSHVELEQLKAHVEGRPLPGR